MRSKDRSFAKRCEPEGAYSRLSLRLILCVVLGTGCALTSSAKNASSELSVDSIDARIAVLQKRVDSFTTVIKTLRDDSAKTIAAAVSSSSPEAKQLADIDTALVKSRSAAADLKVSYDKARQDSSSLAAKFHDQLAALRKTGDSLDKVLGAVRAAAATPAGHPAPRDTLAEERAIARLQGETAHEDSLLRARESSLAAITADIDKLRKDSVAAGKQRNDDRNRFRSQLHSLDSLIMNSEAETNKAVALRATAKAENNRKIAQVQDTIKQMGSQKQQDADRIAALNKELGILGTERADLAKSTSDEQNRYALLRAPHDSAVSKAEADVQNYSQDLPLLQALKTKLSLDNNIATARELLDKAIQAQADNKKGGKDLVDSREARLDTLLSQRDSIVGTTSGLREREAAFTASAPTGGILPLVDSALAAVTASLSAAQSVRDAARKNLAQFEQANPVPKGPAPTRLALMDSMITAKKKEAIQLTDLNDSLNIQMEESQKTLTDLSAAAKAEESSDDSLARMKNDEKATLVKNKAKMLHDSSAVDSTDAVPILGMKTRYDDLTRQKAATAADIDKLGTALAKAKQDLATLQERHKQATANVAAEKTRADSLATARQKQLADITDEQAKNAQAIASIEAQRDQQIRAASDPIAKYVAAIADNNTTTASLLAKSESIRKTSLSGKQSVQDAMKKIAAELLTANKIIDNAQSRIAALREQRETVVAKTTQKKKDQDQAMQEFNDLWSLLSNKKVDDANKEFKETQEFLKKNLDEEHFHAIKATIARMVKESE